MKKAICDKFPSKEITDCEKCKSDCRKLTICVSEKNKSDYGFSVITNCKDFEIMDAVRYVLRPCGEKVIIEGYR